MKRPIRLIVIAALVALLVGPVAARADVPEEVGQTWDEVNEHWPEEVPTPWFCQGVGPHSVCVPPG